MKRLGNKTLLLLLSASALLCLASSGWLYALSDMPFGGLFNTSLLLAAGSVATFLCLVGRILFQLRHRWLAILGVLPLVLSCGVLLSAILFISNLHALFFWGFPPQLDSEKWRTDLHYLARVLEQRQTPGKDQIPKETLDQVVQEIEKTLPNSQVSEIVMSFFRLSALSHDAHSLPFIFLPCFDLHGFPVRLYPFDDGWFIIDAGRSQRHLIG